jgi:hypothetical protein
VSGLTPQQGPEKIVAKIRKTAERLFGNCPVRLPASYLEEIGKLGEPNWTPITPENYQITVDAENTCVLLATDDPIGILPPLDTEDDPAIETDDLIVPESQTQKHYLK